MFLYATTMLSEIQNCYVFKGVFFHVVFHPPKQIHSFIQNIPRIGKVTQWEKAFVGKPDSLGST